MRLPTRKSQADKQALRKNGPIHLTPVGIEEMKNEMQAMKDEIPSVREELIATREMGDLSENAGYQIAKGRLRYLQNRLLGLQERMKRVVEIKTRNTGRVEIGSKVTVRVHSKQSTFHIVGPSESSPLDGKISMISPLGKVLMHKQKGDKAVLKLQERTLTYHVLGIE